MPAAAAPAASPSFEDTKAALQKAEQDLAKLRVAPLAEITSAIAAADLTTLADKLEAVSAMFNREQDVNTYRNLANVLREAPKLTASVEEANAKLAGG